MGALAGVCTREVTIREQAKRIRELEQHIDIVQDIRTAQRDLLLSVQDALDGNPLKAPARTLAVRIVDLRTELDNERSTREALDALVLDLKAQLRGSAVLLDANGRPRCPKQAGLVLADCADAQGVVVDGKVCVTAAECARTLGELRVQELEQVHLQASGADSYDGIRP